MGKFIKVENIFNPYAKRDFEVVNKPQASVMGVFNKDYTKMLLIQQWRAGKNGLTWESPAGILEANECPLSCAIRELEEETGYCVGSNDDIVSLGSFYPSVGFCSEKVNLFYCNIDEKSTINKLNLDEDEFIVDYKWVDIESVSAMSESFSTQLILSKMLLNKLSRL